MSTAKRTTGERGSGIRRCRELPPLAPDEAQALQMVLLGVSTEDHVLARWRIQLDVRGYLSSSAFLHVPAGQRVQVVGTVSVHQAPPPPRASTS